MNLPLTKHLAAALIPLLLSTPAQAHRFPIVRHPRDVSIGICRASAEARIAQVLSANHIRNLTFAEDLGMATIIVASIDASKAKAILTKHRGQL